MRMLIGIMLTLVMAHASLAQEIASPKAKPKEPSTAVLLSLLIPSTGHAYAGNWGRGVGFAAGRIGLVALAFTAGVSENTDTNSFGPITVTVVSKEPNGLYYVSLLGAAALGIWEAVDASKTAQKYNAKLQEQNGLSLGLTADPQGRAQIRLSYAF